MPEPGKEFFTDRVGVCCMCGTTSVFTKLREITPAESDIIKRYSAAINVSPPSQGDEALICTDSNYCGRMVAAKIESTKV